MQFCSKCQKLYPTDMQFCPIDGKALEPRSDFAPGMVLRQKYEILEEIGAGGMGRVFRVKDLDFPYGRNQSALKIPAAHLASDAGFIQRFRDEAAKARVLNHPNVVRVEHIDRTESGVPFLVMELVEGRSLRWWMDLPIRMDWRGAVNIAREIALALDAAHSAGLAHCDIKPENVLSVNKAAPLPLKVTDFGLAKATDVLIGRMTSIQRATSWGPGLVVGTPEYMSPEQARGRELVGPPSDVYSLGAVLFEMLTGKVPYGKVESAEGARRAHEDRVPESLRGRAELPAGLADLVEATLDGSPDRRPSASAVAARLEQLLRPTIIEYRNQGETAAKEAAKMAAALQAREAEAERLRQLNWRKQQEAQAHLPPPEHLRGLQQRKLQGAYKPASSLRKPLLIVAAIVGAILIPAVVWLMVASSSTASKATDVVEKPPVQTVDEIQIQAQPTVLRSFLGHAADVYAVAFSPDGRTLVTSGEDKTIKMWDVATGQILRTLEGHTGPIFSIAFSPDGATLASGSSDQSIKLWDMATGQNLRTLQGQSDYVDCVAFSPDGHTLASGQYDGTIKLWDVASWQTIRTLQGPISKEFSHAVDSVAFSPDSRTLASGSKDKTIKLWDVTSGKNIRTLQVQTGIRSVAFSPDGHTLASGGEDRTIKLWDVASGQNLRTLQGHADVIDCVAFSPGGRFLASGSVDKTVKLWDVASGQNLRTLQGHTGYVQSVAFSPDGRTLASGSWDKTVKLWDLTGQAK